MKQTSEKVKIRSDRSRKLVEGRITSLRSLVSARSPMGSIAISRALKDRSPRVRAAAIETIANEQVIELFDEVNKLLSDPSEVVRVEAVEAIGNIKEASGRHYNDLYSRLSDHRMIVRIVTIEALAQINDRRAIPNIKARLFDASPLVRAFAAIGLAELKCKKCRTVIARCLSEEYEDAASSGYLVALVLLGDRTKITPLLNLLLSRNYRVRCFVANWLPRLRIGRRLLRSVDASLREATKRPLGRADLSTMKETLTQLRRVAKP